MSRIVFDIASDDWHPAVEFLWASTPDERRLNVPPYEMVSKPFAVVTDKADTLAWCRETGTWLFDASGNPGAGPGIFRNRALVAYDVDGTIANNDHRAAFMKGKKNWKAWNAAMPRDGVNEPVAFYQRLMVASPDIDVIILTARDGEFLAVTEKWLADNDLGGYDNIYIRERGSFLKDSIEKKKLLEQVRADYGKYPDFVFDDRNQVTEMMRAEGLFVANCNQSGDDY